MSKEYQTISQDVCREIATELMMICWDTRNKDTIVSWLETPNKSFDGDRPVDNLEKVFNCYLELNQFVSQ
jgi:hypothetical protein